MLFDIVEKKKTFYLRILFLITTIAALTIWVLLEVKGAAILLISLSQFISLLISPNFLYIKKGKFIIEDNEIKIKDDSNEEKTFLLSDIKKIDITIYDGRKTKNAKKWYIIRGFILKIKIETINGDISENNILIKKRLSDGFIKILEDFYKKGLNVKEHDTLGGKFFLLQTNLTYKKIQELKRKYNIAW